MLSPVSVPLESEPELEDVVGELAPESISPRTLPLTIHYAKCDILHSHSKAHRCVIELAI